MAGSTIDVNTYLQRILTAIYGEDVRGSIYDAIQAIARGCNTWLGLQNGSVTTEKLGLLAVNRKNIADSAVNKDKLSNDIVELLNYLDITVKKLNDGGLDISEEIIENDINEWLNDHPEATTTLIDNSVTKNKLSNELKYSIPYSYSTVNDLVRDTTLRDGMIINTLGMTSVGDEYGATYLITETRPTTNFVELDNGLYAKRISLNSDQLTNSSMDYSVVAELRHTICGDSNHSLQGGCYVDSLGHFVFAFTPIDTSVTKTTIIIELDTDFATVIQRYESVNYGHANDMTYNPKIDKIVVSSTGHQPESSYVGKVILLDPYTMEVTATVDSITNSVTAISYDRVADEYYVVENDDVDLSASARKVKKYDSNFNLIEVIGPALIIDPAKQIGQCSFMYKNEFVYVTNSNYTNTYRISFNTFGAHPKIWEVNNFAYFEPEAAIEYNGCIYLATIKSPHYIYVYKLGGNHKTYSHNNEYYQRGTVLKKSEDLNNIVEPGRYYETINSANTITNTPYELQSSFSLNVIRIGYDRLMQILMTDEGEIFVRAGASSKSWYEWKSLYNSYNRKNRTIVVGNIYTSGYISESGAKLRFTLPMSMDTSVSTIEVAAGSLRLIADSGNVLNTTAFLEVFNDVAITKTDFGLTFICTFTTPLTLDTTSKQVTLQLYSFKLRLD